MKMGWEHAKAQMHKKKCTKDKYTCSCCSVIDELTGEA